MEDNMKYIIGIDIGGSTTKIVGFLDGKPINPLLVKAADPLASVYGAFGKFLSVNGIALDQIQRVMITGVGSSFVTDRIFGLPTGRVDEFRAIGLGGLFLSELSDAIIVSMGTGTAYVKAQGTDATHLGGSGVGGGTLLGLSNKMLNIRHVEHLIELAKEGNLANIDLSIGDISQAALPTLPATTTASNFGKLSDIASKADTALGIINLVFQTIGMLAVFAARADGTGDVVLTGNLTTIPQVHQVFASLQQLFGVRFHVPSMAEFATAVGCAISCVSCAEYTEIGPQ